MNTVPASQILRQVWAFWDGTDFDVEAPGAEDFRNLRSWLGRRLREAWDMAKWTDLCRIDRRYFRDLYNRGPVIDDDGRWTRDDDGNWIVADQVYDAGDEVYFPATGKYYRCLVDDTSSQAPADSAGVLNSSYWAECAGDYADAEDWAASTNYLAGDIVRNLDDDTYYQCHTTHTSGAAFETAYWGQLEELRRYIPSPQFLHEDIGTAIQVWDKDPRRCGDARQVDFGKSAEGVTVLEALASVWLEFRTACDPLSGDAYSASTAYEQDQQVYFKASDGTADWWTCLKDTSAGQSPETHPGKWEQVEIPSFWENFLVHGVLADALRSDGQADKAHEEEQLASSVLTDAVYEEIVSAPIFKVRPTVYTR